ncbi:MAG: 16S rRNA processing protein RimM [Clostridia bacterium]|nr:16S rRNA processing protein RimM [Clostridia bacterium]
MTINVGKILKPQGVRGEVKILPIVDDIERFRSLKYLIVKGQALPVLSLRITGDYVYCVLKGVSDRNVAETLRDEFVAVKREDAVKLEEGRHFIVDLIGCEIYADQDYVGVLDDVLQNTKTDVYVVLNGKKSVMFPVVDGLIECTDVVAKKITVNKKRLSEIAVYED